MSKTIEEITAEIVAVALTTGAIKTNGDSASVQASDIAFAFKVIREAVAGQSRSSKKKK